MQHNEDVSHEILLSEELFLFVIFTMAIGAKNTEFNSIWEVILI
jgi:hypothetical protein